jgi:hypothetical protein
LLPLGAYVEAHALAEVLPPETGFLLSTPDEADTVLAPDRAFVRAARTRQGERGMAGVLAAGA